MRTIVASCTTRAGQTSTYWAICLAWAIAEHRTVTLIDCDMEGGTIADTLYLPTGDRSLANCFGDTPVSTSDLEAQAVAVPGRPNLRIIPGLRGTYGYELTQCLRKVGAAFRELDSDTVIVDLGHPLSHPGLRSPRAAGESMHDLFHRIFIVLRDEPALVARSIDVLRSARLAHGEIVLCQQRSRALHRVLVGSLERELPGLPIRNGWQWDERRAARMADTGRPMTLTAASASLQL